YQEKRFTAFLYATRSLVILDIVPAYDRLFPSSTATFRCETLSPRRRIASTAALTWSGVTEQTGPGFGERRSVRRKRSQRPLMKGTIASATRVFSAMKLIVSSLKP